MQCTEHKNTVADNATTYIANVMIRRKQLLLHVFRQIYVYINVTCTMFTQEKLQQNIYESMLNLCNHTEARLTIY